MKKTFLTLAAALMTLVPMSAPAVVRGGHIGVGHFGGGHVIIGGGYPYFYGSYWGPGWGWGPYWGAWGPAYGGYYAYPRTGEVKLDTKVKDAQVFINGAYAGTTHENKTMHLRPGNYNIQIRQDGQQEFAQNVYVTAGKTLKLHPELQPDQRQQN